nr:uncharacterized protein LOC126547162 [Dermacentor andersoni]
MVPATGVAPPGLHPIKPPEIQCTKNLEQVITRFSPLTMKTAFEAVAPDGALQVRPNERLNLLAVDARNAEASERLLKISSIAEIHVRTYEPRPSNCGVGVMKEVPVDLDQEGIFKALQRASVKSVRRLGASENVRIVFARESAPECVMFGYTRYLIHNYRRKNNVAYQSAKAALRQQQETRGSG